MSPKTIAEKVLTRASGSEARAGDVVVCVVDRVLGTDASGPMAMDYFERMGGEHVFDAARVMFALDHYAPPSLPSTVAFHERVRAFAARHGVTLCEVGDGISHQIAVERGWVLPGDLLIGADSHTVTCGALNAFAVGVGSSDLAAAMMTGRIWLRVPETIKVILTGARARETAAKDVALALVGLLGAEGANYRAIEFHGDSSGTFSIDDRLVMCNLAVEMGAKAAVWSVDDITTAFLADRTTTTGRPVLADADANYVREIVVDVPAVDARIALPHAPDRVARLFEAVGTPVQMVFIGTCAGGRVQDVHEVLAIIERGGGHLAAGVQLVVTPASGEVQRRLDADGSTARLRALGAIVTTAGCGACCGTSGVIPADGTNVISTANRNFKARMGNASASIFLASPAACAAAAVTGRITDPRTLP